MSKKAFEQGAEAKARGWDRRNPYHKLKATAYWYAGFDGRDYKEFHKEYTESRRELKRSLGYSRIGRDNV